MNILGVCVIRIFNESVRFAVTKVQKKGWRTEFENAFSDIFKYTATLHYHHTGGDFIGPIGGSKLLHSKGTQSMNSHCRHCDVPSPARVS
jgi:hypothetical protein